MLIDRFAHSLERSSDYRTLTSALDVPRDVTAAVPGFFRAPLVAALFARAPRPTLVITAGEEGAQTFSRLAGSLLGHGRVARIPELRDLPWTDASPDPDIVGERARAIHALAKGAPIVAVTSAAALLRAVPPQGTPTFDPIRFATGEEVAFESVAESLARAGFVRVDAIDGPGTFAQRGGTVDIHAGGAMNPVRVDFFGDEVEGIHSFLAATGQRISTLDSVDIYPVREIALSNRGAQAAASALKVASYSDPQIAHHLELMAEGIPFAGLERYLPYLYKQPGSLIDHLSNETLIVVVEPRALIDDAANRFDEIAESARKAKASIDGLYIPPAKLDFGSQQRLTLASIMSAGAGVDVRIPARRPDVSGVQERLNTGVRSLLDDGYSLAVAIPDRSAREQMALTFTDAGIPLASPGSHPEELAFDAEEPLASRAVELVDADIPGGFIVESAKTGVVSISDVSRRASMKRAVRAIDPTQITFSFEPGDYVVHSVHGIASFKEVVRRTVADVERDYLLLEYAQGDRLFVPVDQIDRVTKYVGAGGSAPRLTRLNTSDWTRATGRARTAAKQLAFDLVDLYARRAAVKGFVYGADTLAQHEMEEAFEFVETVDQLRAIHDVKADMESDRPMDRLILGDVGFGKTEVAMRAAFKAVQAGKQVLVLCPTTILAQQHFTTFFERFEPFGVNVEVMSRFRTDAQQKAALAGFEDGAVHVLVGTHRLLSRDVVPHDLGLVIIDEEQRFGVGHKEQMKNLRESVDVLTLSATPIPRTLQMSLSGVRDMTLITTPPPQRNPIKVHVGEWDEDLVANAIRREIGRGGQVYYVSNRVKSIDSAVSRVMEAAPEARIGVGHGQMSERELEAVMESFAANEIDVLVATTIIESGIDNPHSNTLIIEDAQRLGLAQLYQLKGRVGRSHDQAYAYFLFPRIAQLTDEAIDRLTAIGEYTELGSGMKIAMRDLEIRGAGSLLGAEQHGNMSAVGFDLFSQMLAEAVSEARGEAPLAFSEVKVDLPVHAYLPQDYVEAVDERVRFYRRIAGGVDVETFQGIAEQLESLYGALPEAAKNLLALGRIRILASQAGATNVSVTHGRIQIAGLDLERGVRRALRDDGMLVLEKDAKVLIPLESGAGVVDEAARGLDVIIRRIDES